MNISIHFRLAARPLAVAFIAIACVGLPCQVLAEDEKPQGSPRQFATPEEAIQAVRDAAKAHDRTTMHEIFGPKVHELVTGDEVQDKANFESFSRSVAEACEPEQEASDRIILSIGADKWPFPIPLRKKHGHWFFDTEAGKEEIINRHIGRGELNAIAVCREYIIAQGKYISADRDGSGQKKYAQKLRSTPGKKDGLYWEAGANEEASPFAELAAEAHAEGYGTNHSAGPHPFHGYFFRIVTAQGPAAPGGKMSYLENDNLTKGFALVAYPEHWERSGIMTFIVNQDGKVYQRNLGKHTSQIASQMTDYNPDRKWTLVEDKGIADR